MVQPAAAVGPPPPLRSPRSEAKRKEREARSIAIEKAYVHDVYEQISQHVSDNKYRAWPRVKQFLQDLEPGTLLCDVGKSTNFHNIFNATVINIVALPFVQQPKLLLPPSSLITYPEFLTCIDDLGFLVGMSTHCIICIFEMLKSDRLFFVFTPQLLTLKAKNRKQDKSSISGVY